MEYSGATRMGCELQKLDEVITVIDSLSLVNLIVALSANRLGGLNDCADISGVMPTQCQNSATYIHFNITLFGA